MTQVTDVQELKADLAGTYAVQLSLVVEHLEAAMIHYHATHHKMPFDDCTDATCGQARLLIQNSRRMIEQGV